MRRVVSGLADLEENLHALDRRDRRARYLTRPALIYQPPRMPQPRMSGHGQAGRWLYKTLSHGGAVPAELLRLYQWRVWRGISGHPRATAFALGRGLSQFQLFLPPQGIRAAFRIASLHADCFPHPAETGRLHRPPPFGSRPPHEPSQRTRILPAQRRLRKLQSGPQCKSAIPHLAVRDISDQRGQRAGPLPPRSSVAPRGGAK